MVLKFFNYNYFNNYIKFLKLNLQYDEVTGCMKKIMDKLISEYEGILLKINKNMINNLN